MKYLFFILPLILISCLLTGCFALGLIASTTSETLIPDPPSPPTLIHYIPDPTNDNTPTLDWNDVTGASKYHFQLDNNSDFTSPKVDDGNVLESTYTPSELPDGKYYWRVSSVDRAENEGDFSESDDFIVDLVASEIPTPMPFSPDPTNDNTPTLDWGDVTGAVKYHLQINNDFNFSSTIIDDGNVLESTYAPSELPNGKYYWRVSSIDASGNESDFSEVDNFTVDTEPPPPPTLVAYSPDPTNNSMPTMDWNNAAGASEYRIQIDDNADFSSLVVEQNVSISIYTSATLPDGTYHWRVSSIDVAGNQSNFSEADDFTVDTETLPPPTLVAYLPDPTNDNTPTLDWGDATGAIKYHIQIADNSDFSSLVVDDSDVPTSTYTSKAIPDGEYHWRVRSIDAAGNESNFSETDTFTVNTVTSDIPTLVAYSPDPTNDSTPTLDWNDVTDAIKYHIQINNVFNFSNPLIDETVSSSIYTPPLLLDGTYYWRVSSIHIIGNESSFSPVDSFTIDTSAPAIPILVAYSPDPTSDNTPTLDWNDTEEAVKYHIQIADNSGFSNPAVDESNVSASTYTSQALPDGTYYWKVRNTDTAGNKSDFSTADIFMVDTSKPVINNINPASGSLILGPTQQIVITFNESMNKSTLLLGGTVASESDGGVWFTTTLTDDTLTISPPTTWIGGSGSTLTINVQDMAGNPLSTLILSYDILAGVIYVRNSDGDDANLGTLNFPKKTIQVAIDFADSLYTTAEVHIAEGTHNVSYQSGTHIVIKEGISLYGGYSSTDWSTRDPSAYKTIIQDTSSTGGVLGDPIRAIYVGSGITTATNIDGLTINGGNGSYSSVIYNQGSLTIQNNTINGGEGGNDSYGIFNANSSSPTIQNNTIVSTGGSTSYESYGIYNDDFSSPLIRNNVIDSGSGNTRSYGIYNDDFSAPTIQNNTINGGSGVAIENYGIYSGDSSSPTIENNIIFITSTIGGIFICITEGDINSDPISVRNNDLFDCPTALYWGGGVFSTIAAMEAGLAAEGITTGGNVSVDPLFVDQIGGDWHLKDSSPTSVKEGGLDLSESFATDKDGVPRTVPWSMGAYEKD